MRQRLLFASFGLLLVLSGIFHLSTGEAAPSTALHSPALPGVSDVNSALLPPSSLVKLTSLYRIPHHPMPTPVGATTPTVTLTPLTAQEVARTYDYAVYHAPLANTLPTYTAAWPRYPERVLEGRGYSLEVGW